MSVGETILREYANCETSTEAELIHAIDAAIAEAEAKEAEECCKAICEWCRQERAVFTVLPGLYYHDWDDGCYSVRGRPCRAAAIRARRTP